MDFLDTYATPDMGEGFVCSGRVVRLTHRGGAPIRVGFG